MSFGLTRVTNCDLPNCLTLTIDGNRHKKSHYPAYQLFSQNNQIELFFVQFYGFLFCAFFSYHFISIFISIVVPNGCGECEREISAPPATLPSPPPINALLNGEGGRGWIGLYARSRSSVCVCVCVRLLVCDCTCAYVCMFVYVRTPCVASMGFARDSERSNNKNTHSLSHTHTYWTWTNGQKNKTLRERYIKKDK